MINLAASYLIPSTPFTGKGNGSSSHRRRPVARDKWPLVSVSLCVEGGVEAGTSASSLLVSSVVPQVNTIQFC
jgi:hypothetical protein